MVKDNNLIYGQISQDHSNLEKRIMYTPDEIKSLRNNPWSLVTPPLYYSEIIKENQPENGYSTPYTTTNHWEPPTATHRQNTNFFAPTFYCVEDQVATTSFERRSSLNRALSNLSIEDRLPSPRSGVNFHTRRIKPMIPTVVTCPSPRYMYVPYIKNFGSECESYLSDELIRGPPQYYF